MILVNQIEENKRNEIINLLKDKSLGINLLGDKECLDLYYQTFKNLKRICNGNTFFAMINLIKNGFILLIFLDQPRVNSEYFCNKTLQDYDFYLNLKNSSVYSWTPPFNFVETPSMITRTILKVNIYILIF